MREFAKWLERAEAVHLATTEERDWHLSKAPGESKRAHQARVAAWQDWFRRNGMAWVTVVAGGGRIPGGKDQEMKALQVGQISEFMQRRERRQFDEVFRP